jgi:hypothetical protein
MNDHNTCIEPKRTDARRIWLRVDKALVAKVIKARRALCVGEDIEQVVRGCGQ